MKVQVFIADSVVVAEGKLYALGAGWDNIVTTVVPARHPRLGIGVLIRIPYVETNVAHTFEVRIEDPDGQDIILGDAPPAVHTEDGKVRRLGGPLLVGRPPFLTAGDEQTFPVAANIDGITLPMFGTYRVVVAIDGVDAESLPFRLTPLQQMVPIVR